MSPIIDLNCDAGAAEAQTAVDMEKMKPIPTGMYKLACMGVDLKETSKGRPQAVFSFETVECDNPDHNGKKMMQFCVLPHNGDIGGIGFLLATTKALGKVWEGKSLNTEDYPGRTCNANIGLGKVRDDGKQFNQITSFVE